MKIIGFSSGGVGHESNVDRLVKAIMDRSGHNCEFVKLTDLTFSGCKGCVRLCASPQVCRLEDGATPYYQKIKEADAIVMGSPAYAGGINAIALSFIERFYGYRHVRPTLKDKPFVLAVCGFRKIDTAVEQFQARLRGQGIKVLSIVQYISNTPPCLYCGRHQECSIGGLYRVKGEAAHSLTVTPDLFRRWEDDPCTVEAVEEVAAKLRSL